MPEKSVEWNAQAMSISRLLTQLFFGAWELDAEGNRRVTCITTMTRSRRRESNRADTL